MSQNNSATNTGGSPDIYLLLTTIGTLVISVLDLALNSYVANKQRHLRSECCGGKPCLFDYSSEPSSEEENAKRDAKRDA